MFDDDTQDEQNNQELNNENIDSSITDNNSESVDLENDSEDETPVTVQPVQFASFDEEEHVNAKENHNLDLLMNVNLQMSVELGRTELPFKKVLELTRGSIISLDKLAGEPVELFANGKLVAYGEVVVIEDNFGLRITSIAAPEERLKTVHEDSVIQ
jgi:flagellar motor switch protein FliN